MTNRLFTLNREGAPQGLPQRVSIGRTKSSLLEFGISQVSGNFTTLSDLEAYIER